MDTQIHKTFVRTEVIGDKEESQPKNAAQLREYLRGNKPMLFTLIHKFNYDKNKKYPILSERNDIFVLVDEAHRTQYKQLAENMHAGLPNANYIAFTGTPLLGAKRLTNQWFGDYVSEYNFAQSIEDGSTVPLFYSRRVPEVALTNEWLDTDIDQIVEDENLNERETQLLENSSSRILEVIKRDERLDKIAKDLDRFNEPTEINNYVPCEIESVDRECTDLQVKVREWRDYDIEYWESYGVSLEWLKYAEVYPISHIIWIKGDNRYVMSAYKYAYAYVEHKEGRNTIKVYVQ